MTKPRLRHVLAGLVGILMLMGTMAPPAHAHAELREASPAPNAVVGGAFHQVVLLFHSMAVQAPNTAELYDPAGNLIESTLVRDNQKLIIPIEPLQVPGTYTVQFDVYGSDGDFFEDSFTFRFDPAAPEPAGITVLTVDEGFDFINFGLLLAGAAVAAFLLQRVVTAWREHQADQSSQTAQSSSPTV